MKDQDCSHRPWIEQPIAKPEAGVEAAASFELPDLRVPDAEGQLMRRALVGAHIELALTPGGVAIHESLFESARERLSGRRALVWQDNDRFKVSFGAFSHAERAQVEAFAHALARALGAQIVFATTVGIVVSADASFLQ